MYRLRRCVATCKDEPGHTRTVNRVMLDGTNGINNVVRCTFQYSTISSRLVDNILLHIPVLIMAHTLHFDSCKFLPRAAILGDMILHARVLYRIPSLSLGW